jgi:hypothetical protein
MFNDIFKELEKLTGAESYGEFVAKMKERAEVLKKEKEPTVEIDNTETEITERILSDGSKETTSIKKADGITYVKIVIEPPKKLIEVDNEEIMKEIGHYQEKLKGLQIDKISITGKIDSFVSEIKLKQADLDLIERKIENTKQVIQTLKDKLE